MEDQLELFLLDHRDSPEVIALARRGADTAIEHLPINQDFQALASYGAQLGKVLQDGAPRPQPAEITTFGKNLFDFLFRGSLRTLYDKLPQGSVSVQILSDRPDVRAIPWEFLVTPDCQPSPHRDRSVVRVQPTCGIQVGRPKSFGKRVRVLVVAADPVDQAGVQWEDVVATINRNLLAQLPAEAVPEVVPGVTRLDLIKAITTRKFDVFHFIGHGDVKANVGGLILQAVNSNVSDFISADDVARLLAGKGVRLAVLSACRSGDGNHADEFGIVATALIRAGIPAVVANQYPIPYKSLSPFVGNLYASLVRDGDIDNAVADGRTALAVGLSGLTGGAAVVEWGIPTLHRLSTARRLFKS